MPWARSVIVCAVNYNAAAPKSIDPAEPKAGWIARYAWSGQHASGTNGMKGSDYHDVLLLQLRALELELKERFGADSSMRCYVDTGPLAERAYAAQAGVGWILGVIVTSLELGQEAWSLPAADRCGSCTRCIDACPTDALHDSGSGGIRQMDATRCIAYLTIEKKGSIAAELRPLMGRQVFGCDICQDVCPWNRRAPVASSSFLPAREELINPALQWLADMDGPAFNRVFRGSPLERTRRKRILRNVAIAMGNSGEVDFLPQLEAWAAGDDDVLADAAAWAACRLRADSSAAPR
jgi:epoxyqueuosine reductase